MNMSDILGSIQQIPLQILTNSSITFDIEWWEEDGVTPIEIAMLESNGSPVEYTEYPYGSVRLPVPNFGGAVMSQFGPTGTLLLDFLPFMLLGDNGDGGLNVISVYVPPEITAALIPGEAVWQVQATSKVSNETKTLAIGPALIQPGIPVTPLPQNIE